MDGFDPCAIYSSAQADIDALAKRMGIPRHEVARRFIEFHIMPVVRTLKRDELLRGENEGG